MFKTLQFRKNTFVSVVKNNLTSLCAQLLPLVLVIYFNFFSFPLLAAAVGKKGLMLLECNPWISGLSGPRQLSWHWDPLTPSTPLMADAPGIWLKLFTIGFTWRWTFTSQLLNNLLVRSPDFIFTPPMAT